MIFGWRPPATWTGLDPFSRALAWRSRNVWPRGLTAVVVAALSWFGTDDALVGPWLAATLAAGAIEAKVSLRGADARTDRGRRLAVSAARLVSGSAFAAIALVIVHRPSPIGLAAALLVLCGTCLSNTMTAFGSRLATSTLAGPAAALLILTPAVAYWNGLSAPVADVAVLSAGGVVFVVFLLRLTEAIGREGIALHQALRAVSRERKVALEAQQAAEIAHRRWALIFDQSPLARIAFDAGPLHQHLLASALPGETLGRTLRRVIEKVADLRTFVSVREVNQAAVELCGGEALPRPHLPDEFIDAFAAALDLMGPDGDIAPFLTQVVRLDGSRVDIEAHYRLADAGPNPWSLCLVTYVDMTKAMRVAREHREARVAAEHASRAKTDFLTVVSHELRTPLNGVLGMAQAMAMHPLDDDQADRLSVLRQSGTALLAIVDDLLDMSRIEQGRLALAAAPFEVSQLSAAIRAAYQPEALRRGLAFDLSLDPSAARTLRGDAARVRQVLACLVSNALKFTPQGAVQVRLTYAEGRLVAEVCDTGIGIDPGKIAALFSPFVQADTSLTRSYGGAGLGLALCRELCEAMGGSIAAERLAERGSRFTVILPLPEEPAAPAARPPAEPLRVLAAEDNPVNRQVLEALLAEFGVTPQMVGNGREALEAWEGGDWDLVLMDIQMPEMDGLEATRRIREREVALGRARTPILALTANAMPSQVESYLAAGVNDVVAKPLEVVKLCQAICSAVAADDA